MNNNDEMSFQDDDEEAQMNLFSDKSKFGGDGKMNGRWGKAEHQRFVDGLKKYGKNWKKVEEHVRTRTGAQIRSHAQKFFNRLQKELNDCDENPSDDRIAQKPMKMVGKELKNYGKIGGMMGGRVVGVGCGEIDFNIKGNQLEDEVALMDHKMEEMVLGFKGCLASSSAVNGISLM